MNVYIYIDDRLESGQTIWKWIDNWEDFFDHKKSEKNHQK